MDFRKESYSETLQDFTAVVDTLGREKEGSQSMLMEVKGAAYFSLQPAILKVNENAPSHENPGTPRGGGSGFVEVQRATWVYVCARGKAKEILHESFYLTKKAGCLERCRAYYVE